MYLASLLLWGYLRCFAGASSGSSDWCYSGCENTQSHWESLTGSFCGGQRQSPVDVVTSRAVAKPDLPDFTLVNFSNQHVMKSLENTGHSVQCVLEKGMVEVRDGGLNGTYSAVQFHLHWGDSQFHPGSEHTINGHRYPMEMHIVSLKKGQTMEQAKEQSEGIAVLAFFINGTGDTSQPWEDLTMHLTNLTEKGSSVDIHNTHNISINDLLGKVNLTKFYRYMGSLTTPTCNEAVVWTVFQEPIQISKELIKLFPMKTGLKNIYRTPQRLNGRYIQASPAIAPSHGHWCYDDHCDYNPSHWHMLPSSHCGGQRQSPINIIVKETKKNRKLVGFDFTKFDDKHIMKRLVNTGHSVKCDLKEGVASVSGGGLGYEYNTVQFHFHWAGTSDHAQGSEHTVDTKRYPMEMHIVNQRSDLTKEQAMKAPNGLAVLAFFIEAKDADSSSHTDPHKTTGSEHSSDGWKKLMSHLSDIQPLIDSTVEVTQDISINDLIGDVDMKEYYRYNGSLTTPTCDEVVVWTIFKGPVKVDADLMKMFPIHAGYKNVFRPLQALHSRTVYTTAGSGTWGSISSLVLACQACLYIQSVQSRREG